jgi:hypothetical protein
VLPLARQAFERVLSRTLSPDKVEANLTAYDKGYSMIACF